MWADPRWRLVMVPALNSFMQDSRIKASLETCLDLLRAKIIMPKQSLDAVLGCFTAPQVCSYVVLECGDHHPCNAMNGTIRACKRACYATCEPIGSVVSQRLHCLCFGMQFSMVSQRLHCLCFGMQSSMISVRRWASVVHCFTVALAHASLLT